MSICKHLKGFEREKPNDRFLNNECVANLNEGLTLLNRKRSNWAVLLRDASAPGKYRYQLFDETGFKEHYTFETLELAFMDAVANGYWERDMGALDRLFKSEVWVHGVSFFD